MYHTPYNMSNNEEKQASLESPDQSDDDLQDRQVLTQPPTTSPTVSFPRPTLSKMGISARLDHAMKQKKLDHHSSDLGPLSHDYDVTRKELRTMLHLAKTYKASMCSMDMARTEVGGQKSIFFVVVDGQLTTTRLIVLCNNRWS